MFTGYTTVHASVKSSLQKPEGGETVTIKEFSEEIGLSKGAIYKAIRNSSFQLNQITNRAGQITPEGLTVLKGLFPDHGGGLDAPEGSDRLQEEAERLRDALEESERLRKEAERSLERAEDALEAEKRQRETFEKLYMEEREEVKELREAAEREREKLLEQISEAHRLASQQQELARIASMNPIKRLFSGRRNQGRGT